MKKRKGLIIVLLISLSLFGLFGCQNNTKQINTGYQQITQQEAKKIMDTQSGYIIIDAREIEEFNEGHIKNAVCLPYGAVNDKAQVLLPDKDQLILVYCRSGRRSKIAAEDLVKLGYTNVLEFGGIIDWPYETVTD